MGKEAFKGHEEQIAEIDERVKKMGERLAAEGYKFVLETDPANSSLFDLKMPDNKAGGERNIKFTKKSEYDRADDAGKLPSKKIEEVIEARIRELGS